MRRIEQRVEELLEILWMTEEDTQQASMEKGAVSRELRQLIVDMEEGKEEKCADNIVNRALEKGYIKRDEQGKISLTDVGKEKARSIVRRHRLAEVLLTEVLDVSLGDVEGSACQFEHILNPAVTESVCTFMGHPSACPHGKRIPPDECCTKPVTEVTPLVRRMVDLSSGEEAKVFLIRSKSDATLHKLASLGVVPGARVRLHQKFPSYVISIGETRLALDEEVVSGIFVKKV